MNIALIIAGGSGNRMGQDIPKQFMHLDGAPVIIMTMRASAVSMSTTTTMKPPITHLRFSKL